MLSNKVIESIVPGCVVRIKSEKDSPAFDIVVSRSNFRDTYFTGVNQTTYYFLSILKVISWPVPHKFTSKHQGHYIQVKTKPRINYSFDYSDDIWHKVHNVDCDGPIIHARRVSCGIMYYHRIELEDIRAYSPIDPELIEDLEDSPEKTSSQPMGSHIGTQVIITDKNRESALKTIHVGTWVSYPFSCGWRQVKSLNVSAVFVTDHSPGIPWKDITGVCEVDPTYREIGLDGKVYGVKPPTPISDRQWNSLKEGNWIKIAPEEYIKLFLDRENGQYFGIDYSKSARKIAIFGTWQKVIKKHQSKPSVGVCDTYSIHRDFIVDISEHQPKLSLKELAHKISLGGYDYEDAFNEYVKENRPGDVQNKEYAEYNEIPCKDAQVGDMIFDRGEWHRVKKIIVDPPGMLKRKDNGQVFASCENHCMYNIDRDHWKVRRPMKNLWGFESVDIKDGKVVFVGSKKETIMLDTVEEIGNLDKPNLEEAARQVKASRDNDQVRAAKEKLNQLLNQESELKAQKEKIDNLLAEVQELIAAFGYPPENAQ